MYKAITARVFGKWGGEIVPLLDVEFHEIKAKTWMDLEVTNYNLPRQLDTILPRNIYLVYQETSDKSDFFDSTRPGLLMTLRGFQIRLKPEPLVLLRNLETDEVALGLHFQFRFTNFEQLIGGRRIRPKGDQRTK